MMELAVAPQVEHAVQLYPAIGFSIIDYETAVYPLAYRAISVAERLWLRPGVEAVLGVRGGFGRALVRGPFEAFAAVQIAPHFRALGAATRGFISWRPAIGVELGVTAARYNEPGSRKPFPLDATASLKDEQPDPVYLMFQTSPLRFHVTRYIDANIFGIGAGSGLSSPGRQLRLQINLVEIGLTL